MIIDRPNAAHIPMLRALWAEAFGDSEDFLDLFFCAAFHPERCRCVFSEGMPVCAVYWFDCEYSGQKLAYLYALATVKAFRGRDLARKLMSAVHAHLADRDYCGTLLVPGEESLFAYYEAMGYHNCCSFREFVCTGDAEADVPVWHIDAGEYAQQRRRLLGDGSVLQEGENLRFLEGQAQFFSGQGFLLAARQQEDTLLGLELLGNALLAPGILRSLGCAQGRFRTPGGGKTLAMYLPLQSDAPAAPAYFGFPFD